MKKIPAASPLDKEPSYHKLMLSLVAGALFVIISQTYIASISNHISLHNHIKDLATRIELDMSLAHLWLEESINGHAENTEEAKVVSLFKDIQTSFTQLDKVQQHQHLFLSHPELDKLPSMLEDTTKTVSKLQSLAYTRLAHKKTSGIGSTSDQRFDALFKTFNKQSVSIQEVLSTSLNKHLQNLRNLEIIVACVSFFILIYVTVLIFSFLKRQAVHFQQSLDHERNQHAMEEQYRGLIEQSPFAIQIVSPDGKILQVNQAWKKLWNTSLEDLNTYNVLQDSFLQNHDIYDDIKRGFTGEPIITDVVNLNPNNKNNPISPFSNRFVRIHLYPVFKPDNTLDNIVLIYSDVTKTYMQQAFQLGQADILEEISNPNIPLDDVLTDLIHFVERIKPDTYASILFLDEGGQHLIDGIGARLDAVYLAGIDGLTIGKNIGSCGSAAFSKSLVITDDIAHDPRWEKFKDFALTFNLRACWSQPILDSEQRVLGTFAMYFSEPKQPSETDIDLIKRASHLTRNAIVHKRSMQTLMTSQAALQEAQKMAHLGNWEHDLLNNKVIWSDEKYDIFGVDKETFQPSYKAFMSRVHPDDRNRVDQAYTEAVKSKQPFDQKFRLLLPCKTVKHVHDKCKIFYDAHGTPCKSVGTTQDITQIVQEEEERKQHQEKMEHVQRLESLGVLAGGIAHDFNNILTAILGNAELARTKIEQSSQAQHYIKHITQASQKAANLCRQMLAYSGKGQFIIQATNLSDLVVEMSQLLSVTLPKNVVLRLDLSKQLPAIDADVTQLQQVIMNLVINASEAIGEHSGAISIVTGVVRIDQDYLASTFVDEELEEGLYIYLEVSDTGCGMDAETHARIFEPFFTTKFTGRGLGMAAILGIVRGHEGAIKSYSELGKGTTFKLFFPQSSENASPLPSAQTKALGWRSNGCVLIVDDEETIREVGTDMLIDLGLSVKQASDGLQAIEVYKEYKHDIHAVILDMTMPHMGGEDTYVELCRINPDVQVILSSGYNEQDATNRFAGKGLAGFLQKPYTSDELATQLSKILNKT